SGTLYGLDLKCSRRTENFALGKCKKTKTKPENKLRSLWAHFRVAFTFMISNMSFLTTLLVVLS
ncbi:hypothetical protein BgiMline_004271, partial [Biomphalaria glabrata]